jgi:hypothetical protein
MRRCVQRPRSSLVGELAPHAMLVVVDPVTAAVLLGREPG